MTLWEIVVLFAEQKRSARPLPLKRYGIERWQLEHLCELEILSRQSSGLYYLLQWRHYQPKRRRAA